MRVAVMRCMRGVVTAAPVGDVGRYMAGNVRRKMRMPATNMRSAKMHCAAAATPVAPSSAEVGAPSSAEVDAPTTATAPAAAAAPDAAARQRHIAVLTATASVLTLVRSPKTTSLVTSFLLIGPKPKALVKTLMAIMAFSFPKKALPQKGVVCGASPTRF